MRIWVILLLISCNLLSSCIPVVLGSSTTTGVVLSKEESFGTTLDDVGLRTKINERLLRRDINRLFAGVTVKVYEGKVLLTGRVANPEDRLEIVKITWSVKGVKEVINEIEVHNHDNALGFGDYGKDSFITTNLKTRLLLDQRIRSMNYNIETIKGIVYIIGIAQSNEELNLVNGIASQIKFVKKVVSYVRIKSNKDLPKSYDKTEYRQDAVIEEKPSYKEYVEQKPANKPAKRIERQKPAPKAEPIIDRLDAPAPIVKEDLDPFDSKFDGDFDN